MKAKLGDTSDTTIIEPLINQYRHAYHYVAINTPCISELCVICLSDCLQHDQTNYTIVSISF